MATNRLLEFFCFSLIVSSVLTVVAMICRGAVRVFPALPALVGVLGLSEVAHTSILFFRSDLRIPKTLAYTALFYRDTISQLLELCLFVVIVYGVFDEAMRPFPGLQRVGQIVFRWVGAVSLLVATALSAGPDLFAKGNTVISLYNEIAPRFQQGTNVLVLCLLIFVCFAIRPLGLTFRSHIFGVVLGLALYSTTELIQVGWIMGVGGVNLYSAVYTFEAAGTCVALLVWLTYFALPEPKRRMILLPTTSPFFLWNRISEVLGDAPGSVAVAGFTPDMLAAAEIEMLTMAISREGASAQEREGWLDEAPVDETPELPSSHQSQLALSL